MRAFISVALAAIIASPTWAQSPAEIGCLPQKALKRAMERSKYKEVIVADATTFNGNLVELWVNKDTGTWTLVVTTNDGISCMALTGENWETVKPQIPERPT